MKSNQKKTYTVDEVRDRMMKFCAYQDRCHWEVERKLWEYDLIPEARDMIIIYLIENKFLNEERFTRSFIRGKFNQKKWGRVKIRQELKFRQIPDKMIDSAMEEIDEDDYSNTLKDLFKKKKESLKSEKESFKKKAKIRNFLLQKGYESNLISDLIFD